MKAVSPSLPLLLPFVDFGVHECGYCHRNVAEQVRACGGEPAYGWIVRDAKRVWDFEFHCVWRRPDGSLADITPRPDGAATVLFLPDPARRFDSASNLTWANRVCHKTLGDWAFLAHGRPSGERVLLTAF